MYGDYLNPSQWGRKTNAKMLRDVEHVSGFMCNFAARYRLPLKISIYAVQVFTYYYSNLMDVAFSAVWQSAGVTL